MEVGSPGDKGDLLAGDVIVGVGDEEIKNLDDFKRVMENIGTPDYILFRILRGKDYAFALMDLTEDENGSKDKDSK